MIELDSTPWSRVWAALTQLESPQWVDRQCKMTRGEITPTKTSVHHAYRHWLDNRHRANHPDYDVTPDDICAEIYGAGGCNRYYLLYSGEVVFSDAHGRGRALDAEELGFRRR